MTADSTLVIDAGTSAIRAVLVRADGDARALAREAWPMLAPSDASSFAREFDADACETAVRRLIAAAESERERIAGIAFTGQREGIAVVDETGTALFTSPNIDVRAASEGMAIDAVRADDVYRVTGHLPSLMQAPAKMQWLRANRPEVFERARWVMPLVDWLAHVVTHRRAASAAGPRISRSLAAENGFLDVTTLARPDALLLALDLARELVPSAVADGEAIGEIASGPLAGRPVVLAGADTQCALVGAGAVAAGDAGVSAGWSTPVQVVTASPVFDTEMRTWTSVHVVPQRWILESNAGEMGRAWEWIRGLLGIDAGEAERLVAAASAGSGDAITVLGPRAMHAAKMRAGTGGVLVPLPLVMSAPDRAQVLRSVLESAAYAVRANVEQLEDVAGSRIETVRLGGGMSRSPCFAQILADVLGRPVEVAATPETSSVGAAAVAAPALALHPSLDAAVKVMTACRRVVAPDARPSAAYDDYYGRWCALADRFESMAAEGL